MDDDDEKMSRKMKTMSSEGCQQRGTVCSCSKDLSSLSWKEVAREEEDQEVKLVQDQEGEVVVDQYGYSAWRVVVDRKVPGKEGILYRIPTWSVSHSNG